MTRLLEKYKDEIVPALKERFNITNDLGCPRIEKIVVNMGVGRAVQEPRAIELASDELARITGQKPLVTKARKSVSGFKLRKAMPIGLKVTLRGRRMYEFLDRLISIAMPRIRDFRGVSPDSFDAAGNYSLGLSDQMIFPEVDVDKVEFDQGMDVSIVIRNSDPEKSFEMLGRFGMPFRRR